MALHSSRQYHSSGPQPISQSDLRSFVLSRPEISGNVLSKFKKIVASLEVAYLNHYHSSRE